MEAVHSRFLLIITRLHVWKSHHNMDENLCYLRNAFTLIIFMSNFRRKHGVDNETTIKWVPTKFSAARLFLWIFTVSRFVSYKK